MARHFEPLESRQLLSATYYVSTSGSDSNSGTSVSNAFATLQNAVSKLKAGDTLDVEAGTYKGFIVGWDPAGQGVYGAIDGTATAQITIQADPNAAAGSVIVNSANNKNSNAIDLEPGDDYVTIKGFTVINGDGTVTNEGIKDCGNFTQILNNTVHGVGETGVFGSFSSHSLVSGNVSYSNGEHGIYWSNSPQYTTITGNICHDNASGGIQMNADASQGGPGTSQGMVITDNIIYNNGASGGGALNMDGLQNAVVENNLLFNNHASGLVLYDGDASAGSINNVVANNTIVMASGARPAINDNTNSSGNIFFNNILIGDIAVDSTSTPAGWSNNIISTTTTNKGDWTWPTSTKSTSAALFADTSGAFTQASDYKLSSTSPAIGAGLTTFDGKSAPTTDLLGAVRTGTFDAGAYEFGSNPIQGQPPTITQAAAPSSGTVTGKTVSLSVAATDPQNQALTYTWTSSGPASVSYSANSTGTSNNTTVTFSRAGTYTFNVKVSDTGGLSTTSSNVSVTVNQTLTGMTVSPSSSTMVAGASQQFTATGLDQFGAALSTQPAFTWSLQSGSVGSISTSGQYTASSAAGSATVIAKTSTLQASASITVTAATQSPPTITQAASASTGTITGKTVSLSVAATDPQNQALTYTWTYTGPANVSYSANGSGTSNSTTATFIKAGAYTFSVKVTDTSGLSATSSVSVTVNQILTGVSVSPTSSTVVAGASQQFTATALDQFGNAMSTQPAFTWSLQSSSVGSVSSSGKYTAPSTAGSATVIARTGSLQGTASISVTSNSVSGLPSGWADHDIGSPAMAGSASYSGGTWTVKGGGADIWNKSDQFNYACESVTSANATIVARVSSITNTADWTKAGVMFRDGTAANAPFIDMVTTPDPNDGISVQWRSTTGGASQALTITGIAGPLWVKLVKSTNVFTAFYSSDGTHWTQIGSAVTIHMAAPTAGLAVTAHDNTKLAIATFTSVTLS